MKLMRTIRLPKLNDTERQDVAFLILLFTVSAILYIGRLGFYSDDWDFIRILSTKFEPSLLNSLSRVIREDLPMRPGQALMLVVLYRLFGATPLPYHLFNFLMLTAATV
jgi:hypothetical protein